MLGYRNKKLPSVEYKIKISQNPLQNSWNFLNAYMGYQMIINPIV